MSPLVQTILLLIPILLCCGWFFKLGIIYASRKAGDLARKLAEHQAQFETLAKEREELDQASKQAAEEELSQLRDQRHALQVGLHYLQETEKALRFYADGGKDQGGTAERGIQALAKVFGQVPSAL